jgi:2-polyprenyl-6-methoxyphenol hydroxylase-like FAD-dependent oxidoreductase
MTGATQCVVVGGGPAGIVSALLLARAGIAVTVCEKHPDFLRDFRGDTVHPSTLGLLDELGLWQKFEALPHSKVRYAAFPTPDGEMRFADFGRLRVPHPYVALVPQWDLLDLLAEAGRTEPTFTLRMSTEVTGLIREGESVRGVRLRGPGGAEEELRADLVIAADGRTSIVRREAGLTPREYPCPFDVWWFRVSRRPGESDGMIAPRMRERQFAIALPREGYFQIAYLGPKGRDLRAEGVEKFRAGVAAVVPEVADRLDELTSMDDVKMLNVRLNRLPVWHLDGLLCIGDAAHAMSPIGGVGINLAVQDAVAAARLLAGPLRRGRPEPTDLSRVRRRRIPATMAIQGLQRLLHRTLMQPLMEGKLTAPPARLVTLVRKFPAVSWLPARLIGLGLRQEHAPEFARR